MHKKILPFVVLYYSKSLVNIFFLLLHGKCNNRPKISF